MEIDRFYDLNKYIEPNKVLVIYGPRQVGKTTLLKSFLSKTSLKYKLDSGERLQTQEVFNSPNFNELLAYAEGYELIVLDEAQNIQNIGSGLKILVDQKPGIKIIATGSSSFQLSGQIGEPLTGRKTTLTLFPISQIELLNHYNQYELKQNLDEYLIYGNYPAVITAPQEKRISILEELVNSYLLQDIVTFEQVKGSKVLLDLLRLIAFQVGNEVSLTELGTQLGIDTKTVARYLDLFEKSFVLFNLRGYSRNLRSEITKKSKYYFYDTGIRNALISNYNPFNMRNDIGQLWENFLTIERLKKQSYQKISANNYFWRTWEQKEIDWVEEREGKLFGFEFKYSKEQLTNPKLFLETYPEAEVKLINKDNYLDFIT